MLRTSHRFCKILAPPPPPSAVHGILGLSELLERSLRESRDGDGGSARDAGADLGQQQLQYCRTIRECAQLLQSLVSNVLDYSKVRVSQMNSPDVAVCIGS